MRLINLILSLVSHGQNIVQSFAQIAFRVQTLICTVPNPRLCGDGYLDNEGTRSGLAVSSAYPTHTNLAFPSHPQTRKMLYSSSMHHYCTRATHSSQVQITPSPILFATAQDSIYLFPLLTCLQWYHLSAGRYSLCELGR